MTKRTAMLMAAGVVLALLGGSVALSFGLSGNQTAEAGAREPSKPIVRTIHRTVRVEKQAKGSDRSVQVVTLQAPASPTEQPSSSDDAWDDDDAYEHQDDAYEDDEAYEHEDDAYEHQSGSTEDHSSDDSGSSQEHEDD